MVIITNPVVVIANKMYNKTNHNYELKLNKSSIVESFDFDENHIELRSACTSLSELNGVITGTVVGKICISVKHFFLIFIIYFVLYRCYWNLYKC